MSNKVGLKIQTAYDTLATIGADELIPVDEESLEPVVETSEVRPLTGDGGVASSAAERLGVDGRLTLAMRYAGLDPLLKLIMGTQTDTNLGVSYDQHDHTLLTTAPFATVAVLRGADLWEFDSVAVERARFSVSNDDQLLKLEVELVGRNWDETGGSQNHATWTWTHDRSPAKFGELTFSISAFDASLVAIGIVELELAVEFELARYWGTLGGLYPEEPARGERSVSGSFRLARASANLEANVASHAVMWAQAIFAGPNKAPGNPFALEFYLPSLRLTGGGIVAGRATGVGREEYQFVAEEPVYVPATWPSHAGELMIRTKN